MAGRIAVAGWAMANPWASSSSPMLRGGAMTLKTLVNNHLFLTGKGITYRVQTNGSNCWGLNSLSFRN